MNVLDSTGMIIGHESLEESLTNRIKGTKTRKLEKIEKIKRRFNLNHGKGKRKKKKK